MPPRGSIKRREKDFGEDRTASPVVAVSLLHFKPGKASPGLF
jgi:hypothetical protein